MSRPAGPLAVLCDWVAADPPPELLGRRERVYARQLTGGRRREWTASRITARAALCRATGAPAGDVLPGGDGRPVLYGTGSAGPRLSLAHTGTVAACMVGGADAGPVGVDVEPVHPDNELLLSRVGDGGELAALDRFPARQRATILVSAKEAALKAYGKRFSSLRAYAVSRGADGRLWVDAAGGPRLRLWVGSGPGCLVTLCAASPAPPRVWVARPPALLNVLRTAGRGVRRR